MKTIHLGGRLHENPENISLLKADINYTHIYFTDGSHKLVATTLGILEKRLPRSFFRVNRSTVVSLKNIRPSEKEDQVFSQKVGAIRISRRRKEAFKVQYLQFKQA
ncbi:LytTR family transcriptional regulator [Lacihabitans sp. LS3-19]|uniref:LytTR family DNA-binding domain-containing protein n=1 Tax=Lacihabitans sp. LS3-19 TaxID=2487335 RepID=UPI0020CE06DE|nr:LytTR family DNA-binding domain-containing protein [Lacihabitans sp. LS3-19]MCP9767150.1 LytTR family transcriptional regulator [Lacihabitans sp. LS3-19]